VYRGRLSIKIRKGKRTWYGSYVELRSFNNREKRKVVDVLIGICIV